ncbi:MAG TPA: hypothetical protein VEI24_06140, partial [Nitrospiria bacterium]|nr:hypothetical protein [Nitrospiria bacterium]
PPGAGAPTDGNCGMMGGGPMHGPRRGMMGGCVPSGVAPEALPESDSRGAKMFVRYCAQCHHLPSPATHSAEEWPAAAERMINRMEQYRISRRGMGRIVVQLPTTEERQAIVAYLQRHALAPATTDALGSSDSPGLSQFKQTCSQCHALPDPRLHTATEWPGVVVRMRSNMKIMGKPEITDQERDAIVGYLESR